ncbi:MAG: hypothetical protein K2X08_06390 [Chlamydiales bacterium]|nr:hypothetical protein [Chlamydiales bacterium]
MRYIAALSHVFTLGIKEFGWIEASPVSKISKPREPAGRVRFLSDEEREKLLTACKCSYNPFLYPVVVLAISSGMRHIASIEDFHSNSRKRYLPDLAFIALGIDERLPDHELITDSLFYSIEANSSLFSIEGLLRLALMDC